MHTKQKSMLHAPGGCPSVCRCSRSADINLISKNRHDEVRWREHSGPLIDGIGGAEGDEGDEGELGRVGGREGRAGLGFSCL